MAENDLTGETPKPTDTLHRAGLVKRIRSLFSEDPEVMRQREIAFMSELKKSEIVSRFYERCISAARSKGLDSISEDLATMVGTTPEVMQEAWRDKDRTAVARVIDAMVMVSETNLEKQSVKLNPSMDNPRTNDEKHEAVQQLIDVLGIDQTRVRQFLDSGRGRWTDGFGYNIQTGGRHSVDLKYFGASMSPTSFPKVEVTKPKEFYP